MERTFDEIFADLMAAYYKKSKIGNVKPYNLDHAKRIAWNAAKRIVQKNKNNKENDKKEKYNKNNNKNEIQQSFQNGNGRRHSAFWNDCCQLKLF